ncbi:MAG: YfhO family protein [Anaerolineae bacterium]|nr:YfhO family protein [Anaerolineae bacterium]
MSAEARSRLPWLTGWRADLAALGLLLALDLVLLWPGLMPGQVLMPLDTLSRFRPWRGIELPAPLHNPLPTDVVDIIYPTRHFAAGSLREGRFPLWNPYTFSGYSFVANLQAGLFYPPNLLGYLLPEAWAAGVNDLDLILHLLLAGAGMYFYLRTIGASRPASLGAGIVFMLNGVFVVWLEWHTILSTAVWMPYVWAWLELALRSGRRTYVLLGACALALLLVGGHPQWMMYGLLGVGCYGVYRLVWPAPASRRRAAAAVALLAALGVGLAAIQLLPAFEYLALGHRTALPYDQVVQMGMLPRLVVYLVPGFFGNPAQGTYWGPANYVETTAYVGILPLLLSMIALVVRRDRHTRFFAAMALLALLLAAGTPLYRLIYPLPGFSGLRMDRMVYLANAFLSVLAGLALDGVAGARPLRRRRLAWVAVGLSVLLLLGGVAGYAWHYRAELSAHWHDPQFRGYAQLAVLIAFLLFGTLAIALRLAGHLSPRAFLAVALAVASVDLLHFGVGYNTVTPISLLYPSTETTRFLQADPELFRMVTLRQSHVLMANTGLVYRLADAGGYNYAAPRRYVEYMDAANGGSVIYGERHILLTDHRSPLLDLLNVKYVVTGAELWKPEDVPDTAQPFADTVLPVRHGLPYEQDVTVQQPGLHRIDLWSHEGTAAAGELVLRLFALPDFQPVAHARVDLAAVAPGEPIHFYFAPASARLGRRFRFVVEAGSTDTKVDLQASRTAGLRFACYSAPYDGLVFESVDEDVRVYLNDGYLPRAFVVHQAEVIADRALALARLADPGFDRRRSVVLEETPPPEQTLSLASPSAEVAGQDALVEIADYRLDDVTVHVRAASPGYLVLADAHYPGWRATVDGQPTQLYRANYVLRAVYLPAGAHEVRFVYRPASLIVGAALSGAAALGCVVAWAHARRPRLSAIP